MANEIKITKTVTYENGQLKYTYSPGAVNLPQTTRGYHDRTVTSTSTETDISVTVAQPGLTFLRNLEPTTTGKTVNWGTTEGLIFRLPPKQEAQFQLASSTGVLVIQNAGALAGTVLVQFLMFER